MNAEWNKMNKPPHRTVNLHRHPVFFGNVADVVGDCCGYCPEPLNDEEREVAEEEGKIYVKGPITFLSDDPGRQEIGIFLVLIALTATHSRIRIVQPSWPGGLHRHGVCGLFTTPLRSNRQ